MCYLPTFQKNLSLIYKKIRYCFVSIYPSKITFYRFNQQHLKEVYILSHFTFSNFLSKSIHTCRIFLCCQISRTLNYWATIYHRKIAAYYHILLPLGNCAVSEYLITHMSAASTFVVISIF